MDNQLLDLQNQISEVNKILTFHKHTGLDRTQSLGSFASPLTTKGDLYTYQSANTRLAVGTNGQILSADSTEPTGLKWITSGAVVTPAPLTKTDDSNVTLTLGGTPATSLLQGVSLTLGWAGSLPVSRGGTNITTYTTGDILYSSAGNTLSKLPIGGAGQVLKVVAGIPAWAANASGSAIFSGQLIADTGAVTCDLNTATTFFIYMPLISSPSPTITITNLYDGAQFKIFFRNSGVGNVTITFALTGITQVVPNPLSTFTGNPQVLGTGNTMQLDCVFFSSTGLGMVNRLFVTGSNFVY